MYDEQYARIEGVEGYRALLKDIKTNELVEEILDDLSDEEIEQFFVNALSHFSIPDTISVTTDGHRYENVLMEVSRKLEIRIRRQRCLFHIEKDLAHKIRTDHMGEELDLPKKMIKYMFFQTEGNLKKIGDYSLSIMSNTKGKSEADRIQYILGVLDKYYGDDPIISKFLTFVEENRGEVFLYLKDSDVEKTTAKAEQHFSVMSWLLKHRFKTKQGLLRMSYWHHYYHIPSTQT